MNYQDARSQIEDGDVIAVRTAHSLFGKLTQFFTRKIYTHNGIAVWLDEGLWMVEINGGKNHAIPMSQLEGDDFDVFLPPQELTRSNIRKAALESLRVKVKYGLAAAFMIGLLGLLKLKTFVHWRKIIVCSGYCVAIYEEAGWQEHSRIISPGELADLLRLKLEIRA
ncbi:hypothetical protein [Undibacterium sp. Ren11W]|uniref:hypothetical protein n=1 Tax=Undibacterium sp. Ren11W TaxID=3413045 RepID=UPI003BF20E57